MDIREQLRQLTMEMRRLIEEILPSQQKKNEAAHQRLKEIRNEIHACGCEVTWKATINLENPEQTSAEVTIWQPKRNMSPEEQKLYDEWFGKVNKINEED